MDQLKPVLEQIKKHHFWILCGLIVLVYLGTWFMATSGIKSEFDSRSSAIKGDFSTGEQIASTVNHPNANSSDGQEARNLQNAAEVFEAWKQRFARQEQLLVWPQELHQDFIEKVEPLKPIEAKVKFPTTAEPLLRGFRTRYWNYIQDELPKLSERIKAPWTPKSGAMGGGGESNGFDGGLGGDPNDGDDEGNEDGGGAAGPRIEKEPTYVVQWAGANQSYLQNSRFNWAGEPTTLDILYAQEDLWILTSIMEIIRATNGDADAPYNATIKELMSVDLGADTKGIKQVGQISTLASTADPTNPYGSESGDAANTSDSGYNDTAVSVLDPADNRYVDADYNPVQGAKLRSAYTSSSSSDAFLVVAKRMPVRLRMKMNVMMLPRFITECGNSPLTLEVRQVRVNPPTSGAGGGTADGGGGLGGAGGRGGGLSGSGGLGGGIGGGEPDDDGGGDDGDDGMDSGYGADGPGEGDSGPKDESPFDLVVEVYGIIYLYNPPDRQKLGLAIEKAAADDAADAENADPKAADQDAADQGKKAKQPDQGQPNQGQPNQGQPNQGQPNQGQPNQGQPNQGQPNQGQPNQGQPDQGQPNQGQPNQGQPAK